jgi:hypothetical protein
MFLRLITFPGGIRVPLGGIGRSRGKLESTSPKQEQSSAFVNLHLVINGPNEFAKDHQAQTY